MASRRDEVLDAAVERVASATLDDVLAFLTVAEVASAANLTKGGVTYHYAERWELVQHIVDRGFARYDEWSYDDLIVAVGRFLDGSGDDIDIASAITAQVGRFSPGPDIPDAPGSERFKRIARPVSLLETLHAVVAPNDPDARTRIAEISKKSRDNYSSLIEPIMERSNCVWRAEFDAKRFAVLTQVLSEGFAYVRRFDPAVAPLRLYTTAWLALLDACTHNPDDLSERDARALLAQVAGSVTPIEFEAVCTAAWKVVREKGTSSLRQDIVANEAGATHEAVLRSTPRPQDLRSAAFRGGLAAAVRGRATDGVPEKTIRAYVAALAQFAYDHPVLARAFQATSPLTPRPLGTVFDPASYVARLYKRQPEDARSAAMILGAISLAISEEAMPPFDVVETVWPVLGRPT